jgi:predicted  nucleic acid-binding Zn-ribbon protein
MMSEFETILEMLASLERGQSSLRADVTSLRTDIVGKLETIENELTGIRADMAINMGRVDAVQDDHKAIRASVAQMREELSAHWRQIKRLETDVRELKSQP